MTFAAALSSHPVAAEAVGEVCGRLLECLDGPPDLAVLFATTPHTGVLEDIVPAVRALLSPAVLLGSTAAGVMGGAGAVLGAPGLAVLAGRFPTHHAPTLPVHLHGRYAAHTLVEAVSRCSGDPVVLLLADPFSTDVDALLAALDAEAPGVPVVGGLASGALGPGGNRLVIDGTLASSGAVGLVIDRRLVGIPAVAASSRPVCPPCTVTRSDGSLLLELAGQPALTHLVRIIEELSHDDHALARRGLRCAVGMGPRATVAEFDDVVIHAIVALDHERLGVLLPVPVPVGAVVQFHVVDPTVAGERLLAALAEHPAPARAALVFSGLERAAMRDEGVADPRDVSEALDTTAVAGMTCGGELGPVHRRNVLHSTAASTLVFR